MSTQLADRLLNYEAAPPDSAWQFIAQALTEENKETPFAGKLQSYEVPPPADAWKNIAAELQNPGIGINEPRVRKMRSRFIQVSVAAAAIGFVCIGGMYIFSRLSVSSKPENAVAVNALKNRRSNPPALKNIITQAVPARSLAILSKAKAVLAVRRQRNLIKAETKVLRNAVVNNILFADTLLTVMVNTRLIRNKEGDVIQNINLLNNGDEKYINVTSPNGEQTRISSKFLHALVYLRDNNYLDNFQGALDQSFLESLVWKVKFQSWRKKLLETPFTPSSYNYLDIFQLKELITKEE